jgi:hypothetical protein
MVTLGVGKEPLRILEGNQRLLLRKEKFGSRFGIAVICVSCDINSISTNFSLCHPGKPFKI